MKADTIKRIEDSVRVGIPLSYAESQDTTLQDTFRAVIGQVALDQLELRYGDNAGLIELNSYEVRSPEADFILAPEDRRYYATMRLKFWHTVESKWTQVYHLE